MRILFSARPAFGHVFTLVPLALAARSAGHEVIFGSGEAFLDRIQGWGFEVRKVGRDIESAFEEVARRYPETVDSPGPEFGAAMFVDVLGAETLGDLRSVLDEVRPDIVVYEATDVGAAVASAEAEIPTVCHGLTGWRSVFLDAMRRRSETLWEGSRARRRVDVTSGDLFLDIWPPSMLAPGERLPDNRRPLRPVPWSDPSAETATWPDAKSRARVFVSLGTIYWGRELLQKVIAALSELDVTALVLAGVDATPDDLHSNDGRVRVTGFVNQVEVLRQADLVVNHGGAGTMLGALAHGLPQLVLPENADRPMNAESLVQVGAGLSLRPGDATVDALTRALQRLIEDGSFRARAEDVAAEIGAMPDPAQAVTELEALGTRS